MTDARITPIEKSSSQSGKANTGKWLLEYEQTRPRRADPLMGWAGGANTDTQVKLTFPTSDAAIAYCEREGLRFELVTLPGKRLLLQSYAENFR